MTSRLTGYLRTRPSWVDVGLPALTTVLGMQSVRVLLSLAFWVARDRLKWETELVGVLGLAIFASAFLAAPLRRLLGTRGMLIATAGGLGVLRLAMQAWTGDPVGDFILAGGGVVLFVLFLPTLLGHVKDREEASRSFAMGLLLGFALDATLQGANATYDLSWDNGVAALLVIAVVVVLQWAFLWGLLARGEDTGAERVRADAREGGWGQVLPWLALGPFLFLQMVVFQNLARLVALTEWTLPYAFAWMLFSHAAGIGVALWMLSQSRRSLWPLAAIAGAVLIGALAVPSDGGAVDAAVLLVGQVSIAVLLVMIMLGTARGTGGLGLARTTVAHGLGMILLVGLLFGYYAAYDIEVPYNNAVLLPLAGLAVGVCALVALRALSLERPSIQVSWMPLQLALLLVLVPLVWALTWESPDVTVGTGYPVRVVNYNLHNGFNTDGHLGMEAIARVIEDQQPDVVGLQEVTRGWVVNGSLDMLTWLSQRLEMPYVYGPTIGSLWGNAILSRLPILEWESVDLPPEGLILSRGYLWVRLDLGDGQELLVIDTHLHSTRKGMDIRTQQTEVILDFWNGDDRTVIMGDFNARRYDPQAEMLRQAGLKDVLDLAGIEPGYTVPSEAPRYRIDYIWLSPDLDARDVAITPSEASDHMPIVAAVFPLVTD